MVAPSCFESFRSPVVMAGVRLGFQHFSQKCICVSPVMLSKKANQTWLDIDPEAERVLEFDQAAELAQPLRVFVAASAESIRARSPFEATAGRSPWPSGSRTAARRRSS